MKLFPLLAWALAAAVAVIVTVNALFYLLRARILGALPRCDAIDRIGVLPAAKAFVTESAAMLAVTLALPLGWLMPRCTAAARRGPVVLVHGLGVNSGAFWLLRRRLRRDGWGPVCCFSYGPLGGSLDGVARRLHDFVERSAAKSGQPVTLIAHSAGGLLARYCLRYFPHPSVRRLVTLGTPHNGTVLARRLWPAVAPGSQLLSKLNAADPLPKQLDVIAIHSTFDATILPPSNARYPEAFNVQINDVGHAALLFSSRVYALLAENLAAPLPG